MTRTPARPNNVAVSIRQHLALALRDALEHCDFSHKVAAKKMRVSVRTVGGWARGERPIVEWIYYAARENCARCNIIFPDVFEVAA